MYTYAADLVRIIDGDTLVLNLDLGFYQWRMVRSYRLARINAPELGEPDGSGERSKNALAAFVVGKSLMVQTSRADSFDRWIIELFANNENASDYMVKNMQAVYRKY